MRSDTFGRITWISVVGRSNGDEIAAPRGQSPAFATTTAQARVREGFTLVMKLVRYEAFEPAGRSTLAAR